MNNKYIIKKNTIYIFWHTFLYEGYEEKFEIIINRQLSILIESKIIFYAKDIYVTASMEGISLIKNLILRKDSERFLTKFKFFEIRKPYHEGYTLSKIKEISDKKISLNEKGLILYFHTKGSSPHPNFQLDPIESWTRCMEFFNISRWENCINILQKYYTCGCEMWSLGYSSDMSQSDIFFSQIQREYWHYSGNFWWARMDYVSKFLHHPDSFSKGNFYIDRKMAEYWILSSIEASTSKLEHYPLHFTGKKYKRGIVNGYIDLYPFKYYASGSQQPSPTLKKINFNGELGQPYVFRYLKTIYIS